LDGRREVETMSISTGQLIREFEKREHPLACAIEAKEVPKLIESLRERLECTARELDLSPESLKMLEQRLIVLKQTVQTEHIGMDDEETMHLMREVIAYLSQVLVVNLGGEWDRRRPYLWPTPISVPIPVETIKGDEVHITPTRGFVAADNAAYFWDIIGTGKEKGFLWKEYKAMTQRRWREGVTT
jgi:hypothetical protein